MTVLVLDAPGGPLAPYRDWLADAAGEVVLFTGRSLAEMARHDTHGYASVRCFEDYRGSALVERAAIRLADATAIRALVATDPADAIRAGALRDLLGVAGQGRDDAIAFRDLVTLRGRLERAAVPTLASGAVRRVADLYWYGDRWGTGVRVRRRRATGWPVVAELNDEAAMRVFTCGGLSDRLEAVPSLVAEPCVARERHAVAVAVAEDGWWMLPAGHPAPVADVARTALAALAPSSPGDWRVELVRAEGWCVDSVSRTAAGSCRALVRAQAGLGRELRQAVR
jgi:hypothetical protein